MTTKPCLVLYGNSVFLAGIKAELEGDRSLGLELLSVEAGCPDMTHLLRERKPCAVLFDLGMDQPSFVIPMLRELPGLLLIGVDPSSDELLVLSSQPVQARSLSDLIKLALIWATRGRRAMEKDKNCDTETKSGEPFTVHRSMFKR